MIWSKEELKEHRKQLIEALRSGEYIQGTSELHPDNAFCCLGVACNISNIGKWKFDRGYQSYITSEDLPGVSNWATLPTSVAAYYGFNTDEGIYLSEIIDKPSIEGHLASLNDDGLSFNKIADIIEYYFWNEDHE